MRRGARRIAGQLLEAPVVAGSKHGSQHGGVVSAAGHASPLQGSLHEGERCGGDSGWETGDRVHPTDLAVRAKAAPSILEIFDELPGRLQQAGRSAHNHHVDVRAHGPKPRLSFHGSRCSPTGSRWISRTWPTTTMSSMWNPSWS